MTVRFFLKNWLENKMRPSRGKKRKEKSRMEWNAREREKRGWVVTASDGHDA